MSSSTLTASETPFSSLTPDLILNAVEAQGFFCDGRSYPLNSYENRVYQIGIEDSSPIIAKFYRQGRWQKIQILEEHAFCNELFEADIAVATPIANPETRATLFESGGFNYALFPRFRGDAPDNEDLDQLYTLGQKLGQLHNVGARTQFKHRETLTPTLLGEHSARTQLSQGYVPTRMQASYSEVTQALLKRIQNQWLKYPASAIRLHGDCHRSNILWSDNEPLFVDFDDALNGPAIQDLWMLLSGDRQQQNLQIATLLEGYEEYRDFNRSELQLIESLRSLRMVHYGCWLAKRQNDPAFKIAFPGFGSDNYWQQHINDLKHQLIALENPALLDGNF
ncbi:MAG: serine/threonine protein kinase [Marinagarivorans sp.]|nr:serine/threonine protein kinase [Marinagarivorans sp.]